MLMAGTRNAEELMEVWEAWGRKISRIHNMMVA
jgi:hypothetical protein